MKLPKPSRETKFSDANNADREIFIFPVQLTMTSRIGNLARLIHNIAVCVTIHKEDDRFPNYIQTNTSSTVYPVLRGYKTRIMFN